MAFIWSFIESIVPTVKAEEEEEEEENELVDPQKELRESCSKTISCKKYQKILEECTERVNSRQKTAENCTEEVIYYISCLDHCAAQTLFKHLK